VVRFGSTALVAAAEAKLDGRAPDPAAVTAAIEGLFGADPAIDAVALACTHFPLLEGELAAAAPAGVRWLSSGAAIARRVGEVLGVAGGAQARCGRVLLTGAETAAAAFRARGFARLAASVAVS
ncbi:MAG: glutamate racemase, partial [Hyphomonadaceae bacterium]